MEKLKIVVVGAGPAGMMAAIRAKACGQEVMLLEKKGTLGNKLLLSGKGRCNLTNTEELSDFLKRFSKNGDFLRDAFKKMFHPELISFFEERGLKTKIERQQRVFPQSDRSASILEVLEKELIKSGVRVVCRSKVVDLITSSGQVKGLRLENGQDIVGDRIILACGGASYSFTGSDGSGINLAKKFKHTIVPLRAGLVGLDLKEKFIKKLEGLTLRNIKLKFFDGKTEIDSEIGELIFTAAGISGPLVITLSGKVIDLLAPEKKVFVDIDLKPAITLAQLDARLLREFKLNAKKSIKNAQKAPNKTLRYAKPFLKFTLRDNYHGFAIFSRPRTYFCIF